MIHCDMQSQIEEVVAALHSNGVVLLLEQTPDVLHECGVVGNYK